jgi:hypothetical protein
MNLNSKILGKSTLLIVAAITTGSFVTASCVPRHRAKNGSSNNASQPVKEVNPNEGLNPPPPPPPPAEPLPPNAKTGNLNTDRFLELWKDMHKLSNGYFSPEGIPYHSVETLLVEAPDYGHETTSEAYSYWVWLESMYGKLTKDWSHLDRAWKNLEYYMIPKHVDQPTSGAYNPTKVATFASEMDLPDKYPVSLQGSVATGIDPIGKELKDTYGYSDMYAMHWILDVDNWYGFGNRGDGKSHGSLMNTFQRGVQESVWETVPQPCWDEFNWGGKFGYLDLFVADAKPAKQWKYTNAPDADTRAIQAIHWAKKWADENGGSPIVDGIAKKAAVMGDFNRYAFFDKYFKKIGCREPNCPAGTGYDASHYLLSWYIAWGGAIPGGGVWAWRIGSSHTHSGYQNPMAAWSLAHDPALRPSSANGARDWATSMTRQLEYYRWLQSSEGGFAGGATNSWNGRYEAAPSNTKTFYGMPYVESPVFLDPPSNDWFGFQVWSIQRLAEYYYVTGDAKAEMMLDRWVKWVHKNTKLNADGSYQIPASLKWSGQPATDWNESSQSWDPKDANYNSTLHVAVTAYTDDVGTTAGLVHTLEFYAAKKHDKELKILCRELLDRMWTKYRDNKGVSSPEQRNDFKRFNEKVFVPANWSGKMPNGDPIDNKSTFLSIRSKFKQDPGWKQVEAALNGGKAPEFRFHRFWAQTHVALAYASYGWLFPEKDQPAAAQPPQAGQPAKPAKGKKK